MNLRNTEPHVADASMANTSDTSTDIPIPGSRRYLRRQAAQNADPTTELTDPSPFRSPVPDRGAVPRQRSARPQARTSGRQRTGTIDTTRPPQSDAPPAGAAVSPMRAQQAVRRASKGAGAAFAIAALAVGTTLPAMGVVPLPMGNGTALATSDIRAQSFTAANSVLPDVEAHGVFTATTPAELSAMQAATAAAEKTGIASIAKPGQVIYPMPSGSYTLTDEFGAARPGRSHMGQDFAAPMGSPIYAIADGCVKISQQSYQGYGEAVELSHPQLSSSNSLSSLYAHMESGSRAVQVGDCVTAGQFLGRVGNTGWTFGTVLHFEVRVNENAIDPLAWLEANVF